MQLSAQLKVENFLLRRNGQTTKATMDKKLRDIHNYIRDNVQISDEDKAFFIACILISLKKESFLPLVRQRFKQKTHIYDLIAQNLRDYSIDTSVFEFLRTDKNNEHFYNIICLVAETLTHADQTDDVLSRFYSEFMSYSNSDGKTLGVVLTPDYIANLMISYLQLKPADSFVDVCAGSGAFLAKACKNGVRLTACEYQNKLFSLLKCNEVLFQMKDADLRKGNCFELFGENDFGRYTKSAINPPYGVKTNTEMDFLLLQMKLLAADGLGVAVMPMSVLGSSKNKKEKQAFLDAATPLTVIMLNKDVFYSQGVAAYCSIVVYQKTPYAGGAVEFIDYTDDGLRAVIRMGRVGTVRPISEAPRISASGLKASDDWSYYNFSTEAIPICTASLYNRVLTENIEKARRLCPPSAPVEFAKDDQPLKLKSFLVTDLFEVARPKGTITKTLADNNPGATPFVSASAFNNGITAYTSLPATQPAGLFTFASNGSVGATYYHDYPFCVSQDVLLLTLKPEYKYLLASAATIRFLCLALEANKYKYSYGRKCGLVRIKNERILLPVLENGVIEFGNNCQLDNLFKKR